MKRTSKFQMGYFEQGDVPNSITEMQRFVTMDVQLFSLFQVLGNGIISGWNLIEGSGLSIFVAPGQGHVNYVAVQSTETVEVVDLLPNARNYIYAFLNDTSYWAQTVSFNGQVTINDEDEDEQVYLGYVDTDSDSVTNINTDGRLDIGFVSLIQSLISQHKHVGGTDEPEPVNLASEVQGQLSPDNLPDLDASLITEGEIDPERLPQIDHIEGLTNQGTWTHAQIDSYIQALDVANGVLMGEISTINLLQLVLRTKHTESQVDKDLYNEIAYIPGISPSSFVDSVNTDPLITIDTASGSIIAAPDSSNTPLRFFTKAWDVGFPLKNFILTYEGEIQFGYDSSSESSSSSYPSSESSQSESSPSSSSESSGSSSSSSSVDSSSSESSSSVDSSSSSSGGVSSSSSSSSSSSVDSSSFSSSSSSSSEGLLVRFAVAGEDTADPNDYQYIDENKIEQLSFSSSQTDMKIMIEFHGNSGTPIIMQGFAVMFSGEALGNQVRLN